VKTRTFFFCQKSKKSKKNTEVFSADGTPFDLSKSTGKEGKMTVRGTGISLGVVIVAVGLAGCSSIFGPSKDDEDEGAKFGIGNSGSFVTTGGASGDATPDDITFIVDAFTQRMSFNAKGAPATGVFNFTGKVAGVNVKLHGDIICYAIDPATNIARVAGQITSSDPVILGSQVIVWTVQDNGEGSGPPDKISMYGSGIEGAGDGNCTVATAFEGSMYDIVTGNVQVHM
jgi:hypothetical protein